jgi:tripartite-type tricarboxylate transporter receptor subunit TctC
MKIFLKILVSMLCVLNISLAQASTINVNIIWGFSPSVNAFNHARLLVQQANESQKKYQFNLDFKPGGAGSIAARQVITDVQSNRVSILMTSNAFFVRPYLYTLPGYSFNDFELLSWTTEVPIALVMKKGRKFEDILKQPHITVAVAGMGSMSHVMAERLRQAYPNQITVVGYPGSREGVRDLTGGHIDLAFDLLGSVIEDDKVDIIGITGNNSLSGLSRLADLGPRYSDFKIMGLGIYFLIPRQVPTQTTIELYDIILQAQRDSAAYKNAVKKDFGIFLDSTYKDNEKLYQSNINQLKRLTASMQKLD